MKRIAVVAALLFATSAFARDVAIEVTGTDGVKLAGTLTLPDNATGRVPALLLIQGSGPTDRDGNNRMIQVPIETMRSIATSLASSGIASLRLDKRGMYANAASMPTDRAALPAFFRWDAYVGDLKAALAALSARPEIDSAHVGVLGHSEGGLVALALVADQPPRPLILIATAARRSDALLRDQLVQNLPRNKVSPEDQAVILAGYDRAVTAIREKGHMPDDLPTAVKLMLPAYLIPFLAQQYALDPIDLAKRCRGPVLLIQGERDTQISPTRDAAPLIEALRARSGKPDSELVLLPDTSHALKHVTGDPDPAFPAAQFSGPVEPAALDAIRKFAKEKL